MILDPLRFHKKKEDKTIARSRAKAQIRSRPMISQIFELQFENSWNHNGNSNQRKKKLASSCEKISWILYMIQNFKTILVIFLNSFTSFLFFLNSSISFDLLYFFSVNFSHFAWALLIYTRKRKFLLLLDFFQTRTRKISSLLLSAH